MIGFIVHREILQMMLLLRLLKVIFVYIFFIGYIIINAGVI